MKLSRGAGYALVSLKHLIRQPDSQSTTAQAIAEAYGLPRGFLGKTLQALAQARILHSMTARGGGFRLARPVQNLTLLEVVEAVDGPRRGETPELLEGHDNTEGRKLQRQLQALCDEATRIERELLAAVTVADLVERPKSSKKR